MMVVPPGRITLASMRRVTPDTIFPAAVAAWIFGMVGAGWYTGFLAAHNDFWGNVFIAQQMRFGIAESFHNGFFPLGYPLLLKVLSGLGLLDVTGFLVSLAASVIVLVAAWSLARRLMPGMRALATLAFIALHPLCFFYFSTAGVDSGAMAFFLGGMALAISATGEERRKATALALASGLLLGLAALWRYHALIAGVLLLVSIAVAYRRIGAPAAALLAMMFVYLPQALVNASLGLSPLHTSYELAVYDLMYDVNWHRLGELDVPPTMFEVLLADPVLFFMRWLRGFLSLMAYAFPAIGFAVLARGSGAFRFALASSLFLFSYAVVFGVSAGGRAPLLVLPLAIVFWGGLGSRAHDAMKARVPVSPVAARAMVPAILLVILCYFSAKDARVLLARAETDAVYRSVERFLVAEGLRDAREVFTTDFDIYFREIPPFRPRYNGGWGLFGTYRWPEEFPQAPTSGLDAFLDAAHSHNWRYLILSPRAGRAAPFLGDVYAGTISHPGLVPVHKAGRLAIFTIMKTSPQAFEGGRTSHSGRHSP